MSEFQLINAGTPLCQQTCVGDQLQITCLKSNKINTNNVNSTNYNTNIACVNKVKIKSFTTLESSGNTPTTVTKSVIATTTTDNVYVTLDPSLAIGCIIYVIHESGNYDVAVTGTVLGTVYIGDGRFGSFIKTHTGWVPNQPQLD